MNTFCIQSAKGKRGPVQGCSGEHYGTCPERLDVKCFAVCL